MAAAYAAEVFGTCSRSNTRSRDHQVRIAMLSWSSCPPAAASSKAPVLSGGARDEVARCQRTSHQTPAVPRMPLDASDWNGARGPQADTLLSWLRAHLDSRHSATTASDLVPAGGRQCGVHGARAGRPDGNVRMYRAEHVATL